MKPHTIKKEIMNEILEVYDTLPNEFYAHTLFEKVCRYVAAIHQRHIYPDTCMRYFRELRQNEDIRCECVNRQRSLYMKSE